MAFGIPHFRWPQRGAINAPGREADDAALERFINTTQHDFIETQVRGLGSMMQRSFSDQSITAGGSQKTIQWNSLGWDIGGFSDLSNYKFTIPAGMGDDRLYTIGARIQWASAVGEVRLVAQHGTRSTWLHRDGATNNYQGANGTTTVVLDEGDDVWFTVYYSIAGVVRYFSGYSQAWIVAA